MASRISYLPLSCLILRTLRHMTRCPRFRSPSRITKRFPDGIDDAFAEYVYIFSCPVADSEFSQPVIHDSEFLYTYIFSRMILFTKRLSLHSPAKILFSAHCQNQCIYVSPPCRLLRATSFSSLSSRLSSSSIFFDNLET